MRDKRMMRRWLAATAWAAWLLLGSLSLSPARAEACEPPVTMWSVPRVFPTPGGLDAPLNGRVVVGLEFLDASSAAEWPEQSVVEETVNVWLTREQEVVEGALTFDRVLHEVAFTADLPMAEGIEYTVHIELLNSYWDSTDSLDTATFTTGDRFDEAPPAFSGLQSVLLTERSLAVQECCPSTEEYCLGSCGECVWCWTTDWQYLPIAQLSYRAADDEFGPRSLRYAVYELGSPDDALGEPVFVDSPDAAGTRTISLDVEGPGPYCFAVRAHDAYGRWDGNTTVTCVDADARVPIARLEIPEPDRQFCAELPSEDVGVDAHDSGTDLSEVGNPIADAGTNADADAGPAPIQTSSSDDGCGCSTQSEGRGSWLAAVVVGLGILATLRR